MITWLGKGEAMRLCGKHVSVTLVVGTVLCLALAGCGTDQTKLAQFFDATHKPMGSEEYRVMPPDIISINARPTEEYGNLRVRLGPDGKAFLPLIGEFQLANKTTTQIAAELTENLQDYYDDVQVSVMVTAYRSQRYYVFGEVSNPGPYPFTGNDSLLSALATAGPTRLAMPEKIHLVRGLSPLEKVEVDEDGTIKNNVQKVTINLLEMISQGDVSTNMLLANNDVIYVPANPAAKIGLVLQNLLLPVNPVVNTIGAPRDISEANDPSSSNTTE